jgi:hypothetical protein
MSEKVIQLPALPKSWDELSAQQMVKLNRIRHQHGRTVEEFMLYALCYLMRLQRTGGMEWVDGRFVYEFQVCDEGGEPTGEPFLLTDELIYTIVEEHLKFLKEDSTRLQDVFPKITLRRVEFCSPGYAMSGMTYQQFQFAQRYMGAYHQATTRLYKAVEANPNITEAEAKPLLEQREDLRRRLMATLFTPATKVASKMVDGKQVVFDPPVVDYVFSTSQVEQYADCFVDMTEEESDAVIQHFTGVMLYYKKIFPLLFSEGGGGSSDMIRAEESTLNALQDKLRFSNYQTIYDSNAPFILGKLHAIIKEAKEIENAQLKSKARRKS